AGYLCAIEKSQFVWKKDQILFFNEEEFGHAAVPLPPVGAAIPRTGARNHVTTPAVVAHTTTGDVIDDHPVTSFESPTTGTGLNDLPRRLVAGYHTLISFRPFAK